MKTNLKLVSLTMVLAATCVSGVAYASCPAQLTAEELVSCVHIEGAGMSYQDYLAERSDIIANAQAARAAAANQDIATKRPDVKAKDDEADKKITSSVKP